MRIRAGFALVALLAATVAAMPARAQDAPLPAAWDEEARAAPFTPWRPGDDSWTGMPPAYGLALGEVVLFDALLNLVNRSTIGNEYKSTMASVRRNLQSSWTVDRDPFETNQF